MKIFSKKLVKHIIVSVISIAVFMMLYYVVYLYCGYQRIANIEFPPVEKNSESVISSTDTVSFMTYNIGFGAYSSDFSFFLDGGEHARAFSREDVEKNVNGAVEVIKEYSPDIIVMQEVDVKGTRSYGVDQAEIIQTAFDGYNSGFAVNYDSPYFLYPLHEPIGKNKSGILTLSKYTLEMFRRNSLPVEEGFSKYLDLDRCFTVSRIPVDNNKKLMVYNVHLSAYTKDGTLSDRQLEILLESMKKEYDRGCYVIALGDFNKDLLIDSSQYFERPDEEYNWAKSINTSLLPSYVSIAADTEVPTCRNANKAYAGDGSDFVITIDGALVSDNIEIVTVKTIDTGFEYSDHNPVYFEIKMK